VLTNAAGSDRAGLPASPVADRYEAATAFLVDNDLPVAAHIGPDDIIGTPLVHQSDIAGTLVTRFYPQGGRWLGLADEGMLERAR
jgi:hypothetical protein